MAITITGFRPYHPMQMPVAPIGECTEERLSPLGMTIEGILVTTENGEIPCKLRYIQAGAAIALGDAVRQQASILASEGELTADANVALTEVKDADHGIALAFCDGDRYKIAAVDGTNVGEVREITSNTAAKFDVAAAFTVAITSTENYIVYRDYRGIPTINAALDACMQPLGIGIYTITIEYYGWVFAKGNCPVVHIDGTDIAIAALNSLTVSDATAKHLTHCVDTTAANAEIIWGSCGYACDEDADLPAWIDV